MIIKGIIHNPKGKRNLTSKEKEEIKERFKYKCYKCKKKFKSRGLEVEHIKPVGLKKPIPILNLMNTFNIETTTNKGKPRKHSYDYSKNLKPICKKCHKKKTPKDIKNINKKRRKDIEKLGLGRIELGI